MYEAIVHHAVKSLLTIDILTCVATLILDINYMYKVVTHLAVVAHHTTQIITYVAVEEQWLYRMVACLAVIVQPTIHKLKYVVTI